MHDIALSIICISESENKHIYPLYHEELSADVSIYLKVDLRPLALQNVAEIQTASTNRRGAIPYFKVTVPCGG